MILDKPEEPGKKYALAFTILVHVALLAFLFFGVPLSSGSLSLSSGKLLVPS